MSDLTVIPVPGPGAEDVVVAGSGADEGSVYTGTEDGSGGTAHHMVTGVREHDGRVWMGSLHEPAVAVVDL